MPTRFNRIPPEVMSELNAITNFTKSTGREASITFCQKKGQKKVYVGGHTEGDETSTDVEICSKKFGNAERIGDAHTHPVAVDAVGIVPSEADMVGTLQESFFNNRPQVGCITSHYAPHILCMQPKYVPSPKELRRYEKALGNSGLEPDPYFIDNINSIMDFGIYKKPSGIRDDEPDMKELMRSVFGKSGKYVRRRIEEMERGPFCNYIQQLTVPENDDVSMACKEELRTRKFAGIEYEKYLAPDLSESNQQQQDRGICKLPLKKKTKTK